MSSPLDRKVAEQDQPQHEELTRKLREERDRKAAADYEKEVRQYEKDKADYEKEVKAAEAKYQAELKEFEKQQSEANKQTALLQKQEDDRKALEQKYNAKISKLQADKQAALAEAHSSVYGPGGSRNRSDLTQKQNVITRQYSSLIDAAQEEQRRSSGRLEFSIAYPSIPISQSDLKRFEGSPSQSLVGIYEKKIEGKQAKSEYSRQGSIQTAQAEAAKARERYAIQSTQPYIGFGLEEGKERAAAVKSTPDVITGKQAVKTRARLTGVDTGQSIMGGQKASPSITITSTETYRETSDGPVLVRDVTRTIPEKKASKGVPSFANPVAFAKGQDYQDVSVSGKLPPIKGEEGSRVIYSFRNLSDVQDPSAIALLEFQQQLKTKTAPSATVYKGILEERGLSLTPLSKRIIDTFSSKGLFRGYEEPVQAKGRKAVISKDGVKLFDMETGEGSVRIGHLLGYKYSKPVMVNELGKDVQGPPTPVWTIPDAFGQPRRDFSGNVIELKSEEKAQTLAERFAKKSSESKLFVNMEGQMVVKTKPEPQKTGFNKALEYHYNKLGELQQVVKTKDPFTQLGYIPAELQRMGIGAVGFVTSSFEQHIDPLTEKALGLKPTPRVAPIDFKEPTSDVTILSFDYKKEYSPLQNVKAYIGTQTKFVEKQGFVPYATGLGVTALQVGSGVFAVKLGIEDLARSAPKITQRLLQPALPRIGRAAKSAAIQSAPSSIFKGEERFASPSKKWDISEPVSKVGFRIERRLPPIAALTKRPELAAPNPFGKERIIPYTIRQAVSKAGGYIGQIPSRIPKAPLFLKNFADISLNPAHLGTRPNIPTRQEISAPAPFTRTYPTIQKMRGIFYPDISPPPKKTSIIPPGFVKINPKLITAKESAKKIAGLPKTISGKIKKTTTPDFIKQARTRWQGFTFMQKKRFGEFKQGLPTLPKFPTLPANQFVTLQRKARDIKKGILETKRLSSQLFEFPVTKKETVPAFSKQGLKNLTREDIGIPSIIKEIKRQPRLLSLGVAPLKSPPVNFTEELIEYPLRARKGKAPIEISFRADVSGLGSISPKSESFYAQRRQFPKQSIEFESIPKKETGFGMGEGIQWPENWMLKQRTKSQQEFTYRLETTEGKRQWVEYPVQKLETPNLFRSSLPSPKQTRTVSERMRQLPKFDPTWSSPPKTLSPDDIGWKSKPDLLREMKQETNMLFSDPKRGTKINTKLIKLDMDNALSDYYKTATPFQLKPSKIKEWPKNWKDLAKQETPDVADYLSQKRSFRSFGKTEKEKMLKGAGSGALSYDVGFKRYGKQVPTTLFTLEKATPPVQLPTEKRTGMFRMLERSAEEQRKLDEMWGQGMARVMKERKKGDLPNITTRTQDTSKTVQGKARLSFVSEPLRTTPIVIQRGMGIFDKPISVRKGKLLRGLKPVRDARDYLPDRFAETRITPKGGKPPNLSSWKPKPIEQKETIGIVRRERINKYQILKEDTALGSIVPAKISEKLKFTKTEIKLGRGKTDVFGRRFEKSPIDSPVKDLTKGKTNWDKLAGESKKTKEQKNKAWKEEQKRIDDEARQTKGGQIVIQVPPKPRSAFSQPEPMIPEEFGSSAAVQPTRSPIKTRRMPIVIPPLMRETKKRKPTVQEAQISQSFEIPLYEQRPKISTRQTSRISPRLDTPQRSAEGIKFATVQPQKLVQPQKIARQPKYKEAAMIKPITISLQTPRQAQRQPQKISQPTPLKIPTRQKQPPALRQPPRQKTPQLLRQRPPRKPPRILAVTLLPKEPAPVKQRKTDPKEKADFLGSAPESSLVGLFKRQEITYGQKRIANLLKGDVRVVAGKPRVVRTSKKQKDILGFDKKKKKQTTSFW